MHQALKAPEHSFAYTKKTIEPAFGLKLPKIFDNFEDKPVASGSIAQVHRLRATLRFRRDFVIINLVVKLSNCIPALKLWRLDESVQQFAVLMMSQVDLAREAAHLRPLVHPAVLVETYEQGECCLCWCLTGLAIFEVWAPSFSSSRKRRVGPNFKCSYLG
ncbi:unnamed protein product [Prunus armeniaca]|uniref:ABC1 atypical kinase-like domain-containing protein n=1 Tax=Prunus armeniaca TaxID=36596 RepID=A0A6J5V112_PRUAR|nr:unnamed protein product [Prunus armeniaca]